MPDLKGMWLDAGELEMLAIVDRTRSAASSTPSQGLR